MSHASDDDQDSKLVPMVLSFFIWGAGQLYDGRTKAGAVWLVVYFVSWTLTWVTGFLFAPLAFVLWVVSLYDTYAVLIDIDE